MRKKIPWQATGLLVGAGLVVFAGRPGESVAQTRAETERERLSLSAAIEEARRSPFYAWAAEAKLGEGPTKDARAAGTATSHRPLPEPLKDAFVAPPFGLTLVLAELSHLATTALLFLCFADGSPSSACLLILPAIPLPVVALPAKSAGLDWGKALGTSAIGWAGGVGAFVAAMRVTENIDDANPFVAGAVSGLVHAAITTILVRRR